MRVIVLILFLVFVMGVRSEIFTPCDVFSVEGAQEYVESLYNTKREMEHVVPDDIVERWVKQVRFYQPGPEKTFSSLQRDIQITVPVEQIIATCATVEVPLNYMTEENIQYFIKKYSAFSGNSKKSIWLIQGGPGISGVELEFYVPNMMKLFPDADFYIPDPRGTGRSSRLDCFSGKEGVLTEEEINDCIPIFTSTYQSFSNIGSTFAARDIQFATSMLNSSLPNYYYGFSYGSFVLNRFIQLFPDEGEGFIFNGVCPPGMCHVLSLSSNYEESLRNLMIPCGHHVNCSQRLTKNPMQYISSINSNCEDMVSELVTSILSNYQLWPLIYPFYYRIARCSIYDVGAIVNIDRAVYDKYINSESSNPIVFPEWAGSHFINELIVYSELYDRSWTLEKEIEFLNGVLLPVDASEIVKRYQYYKNIVYLDPDVNHFPTSTNTNILLLNGKIDVLTPASWAKHYFQDSPSMNKYIVLFENHGHNLIVPNANKTITPEDFTCSLQITSEFINGNANLINHECLNNIAPYGLEVEDAKTALSRFGIIFHPYDGGAITLELAIVIAAIALLLSLCTCSLGCVSYCCCCRPKQEPEYQ